MFVVELSDVDGFHGLVRALTAVVQEGDFTATGDGLELRGMDTSRVAMVDFCLPAGFFYEYRCPEETRICLNMESFEDFLDRAETGEQVRIEVEEGVLFIRCRRDGRSRRFTIPLMEPITQEAPRPEVSLKARARLMTSSLYSAIRDASLVSEHVEIEADREEGTLYIRAEGDLGSVNTSWRKGSQGLLDLQVQREEGLEGIGSMFTLSYLQDIVNAARRCSEVATLELGRNIPLKLDFGLPEGKLLYYVAPVIQE